MSTVVVLAVGVAAVLLLPITWRVAQRRFDLFEPIVVFALAWGVMFVVRPIAIVIREDTNFYGVDIGPTLDKAVFLGLLGTVGFVVGYETRLGHRIAARLAPPPTAIDAGAAILAACVVAALGVAALALVLLPNGGVDALATFLGGRSTELNELIASSTVYFWYGSLLVVPAAMTATAVAVVEHRRLYVITALLLVALALVRTLPTGNRAFLLVLIGGFVVFAFLRLRKRPGPFAVALGLVLALVASYSLLTFRYPETRGNISSVVSRLADAPSRAVSPLFKGPDAEMAPALAGALRAIPSELGHRYGGATLGDLVVRPIPRALWPDKPTPPGQRVTSAVWPVARETGAFDPAFTPLLVLYWDFWLAGVAAGMATLGILSRALREYFQRHRWNVAAQLVYAAGVCFLVLAARHDPVTVFVWSAILFVPIVVAFRLAAVQRGPGASPFWMSLDYDHGEYGEHGA